LKSRLTLTDPLPMSNYSSTSITTNSFEVYLLISAPFELGHVMMETVSYVHVNVTF